MSAQGRQRSRAWLFPIAILLIGVLGSRATIAEPGAQDGAAVFKSRCANCHGALGKADTVQARALKVRPLSPDANLAKMDTADMVQVIKSDPKHQGMASLDGLTDSEIKAVAVFVKKIARKQ